LKERHTIPDHLGGKHPPDAILLEVALDRRHVLEVHAPKCMYRQEVGPFPTSDPILDTTAICTLVGAIVTDVMISDALFDGPFGPSRKTGRDEVHGLLSEEGAQSLLAILSLCDSEGSQSSKDLLVALAVGGELVANQNLGVVSVNSGHDLSTPIN
jgi:hypothetical protein